MKRTKLSSILSFVIATVLIAAMAFSFAGCDKEIESTGEDKKALTFTFICTDIDGKQETHTVKTEKSAVGDALVDQGLISGEEGQYGLYVKTVCGITADYDTDGTYWAFYINGEYAMTGVDKTDITDGETYELKIEK